MIALPNTVKRKVSLHVFGHVLHNADMYICKCECGKFNIVFNPLIIYLYLQERRTWFIIFARNENSKIALHRSGVLKYKKAIFENAIL